MHSPPSRDDGDEHSARISSWISELRFLDVGRKL
jgi:hypothetical protein